MKCWKTAVARGSCSLGGVPCLSWCDLCARLGPTRTQLTTKWLVHREAVEGVDYQVEELTRVWISTNEQDRRIVHENQIGMNTPTYEPGPFSHMEESGVGQFVDWYSKLLEKRLSSAEALTDVA